MKTFLIAVAIASISVPLLAEEPDISVTPSFETVTVPLVLEPSSFNYASSVLESLTWLKDSDEPSAKAARRGVFDPLRGTFVLAGVVVLRQLNDLRKSIEQTEQIVVGEMLFSKTTIAGNSLERIGPFSLRQVSIPLVVRPTWNKITDFADDFSHFAIELRVFDAVQNNSPIQVCDILPNTQFVSANHGAKMNFNISLQANRKWGPVDASTRAESSFWWEWNPQVNIVASGAAGDTAFAVLNKKPDNTGWIGKIPVELLLLVPHDMASADLIIRTHLVYRDNVNITLAEVAGTILFYE